MAGDTAINTNPDNGPAQGAGGEATSARPTRPVARGRRYDWSGALGAILFFCLSLTPSLLPRSWYFQALVGGIAATIGYGVGVVVGYAIRWATTWEPSARTARIGWRVLAILGPVLVVVFLLLGHRWQREIHHLMGQAAPPRYHSILILVGTALTVVTLLEAIRVFWRLARWIGLTLDRWLPARTAGLLGIVLAAYLTVGMLHGFVWRAFEDGATTVFTTVDDTIRTDVAAPSVPEVSGSPASLVRWDSLGKEGRLFVTGATSMQDLQTFSGGSALRPIRAFAGLDSASGLQQEANLVLKELERTRAFERKVLAVATTTGTGWVDPYPAAALEYLYNGDSAIAAMQYSPMPSTLSFLIDADAARQAGRTLFTAVYERWTRLPKEGRPKLLVFGESLGSFGGEAAFGGVDDIRNRTDGILWSGPTAFNDLHTEFTRDRRRGTPQILPVYENGSTVRFGAIGTDLNNPPTLWTVPKVVYLQHPSDPICWWNPALLLHEPDWLKEPRGRDVSRDMRWYPLITFFQVAADLANGLGRDVPAGHGHRYGSEQLDAWLDIAPPPGWTPKETARLKTVLALDR